MKKFVNIICTAIICLSLTGQAELVFNTANEHVASEPPDETTESFRPVLNSDSTSWDIVFMDMPGISMLLLHAQKHPDSIYAELYSYPHPIWHSGYPQFPQPAGKIREDTISGKLWFLGSWMPEERLVMDLTLDVGDTFEVREGLLTTVDSVYFLDDGRKIISFDRSPPWWHEENFRFIEGVGPNFGFSGSISHYVTCKYDNDELVYVNTNNFFDGCLPFDTGINPELRNGCSVRLFPNPAGDVLYVDIDPSLLPATEIIIYNVQGIALIHKHLQGYNHTISLGDLTRGLYFVSIKNGAHCLRHKIMIN